MAIIALLPFSLFFLASFLLTRRWYLRAASVPGLFLGAVVQPLVTALLFFTGLDLIGQSQSGSPGVSFASLIRFAVFTTGVIATPLALLSCLRPVKQIRALRHSYYETAQDNAFAVLMMAGIISLACAMLGLATFYFWFGLND